MRVLLDTNTAIWLASDPAKLRPETIDLLQQDKTVLVLSAVVPWEIAIKWRSGKLTLSDHPRAWVARLARELGTQALPFHQDHAVAVADLPTHHADPFDRLLIAQAGVERMPVVTADSKFVEYGVEVIPAR